MANHAALIRAEHAGKSVHRRGRNFIEFDNGNGTITHVATIDPLHVRGADTLAGEIVEWLEGHNGTY